MIRIYAALGLGVLTVLGLASWRIDARAYERGAEDCRAAQAEVARLLQAEIDRRAVAQREAEVALAATLSDLDTLERRLADEALAAPGADAPAFDAGSILRLNAVR